VDALAADDDRLPSALAARLRSAATGSGHDPSLVADFAVAVLRRLPDDSADLADTEATATTVLDLFELVVDDPGPTVRTRRCDCSLLAADTPTTVVQLHTPDRPFLLSTVMAALRELGHEVARTLHPVLGVVRDDAGRLVEVVGAREAEVRESLVHLELTRVINDREQRWVTPLIEAALVDLRASTDDWDAMRRALEAVADRVEDGTLTPGTDEELRREVAALLRWLDDGNLVLLGMESYDAVDGRLVLRPDGLGVLRRSGPQPEGLPVPIGDLEAEQRDRLLSPRVLRVTRTPERSLVQRRAAYDAVVVIARDDTGRVVGLTRVVGLFTRGAMAQPARTTPVLRRRLARLLEREDVVAGSHDEALLVEVFESMPRDELFGADVDELSEMVVDLVVARERDEVRAVVRHDPVTDTASVVATVPRYRYDPEVRRAFTEHLQALLTGPEGVPQVDVDVSLADDHEVLVRFVVHPLHRDGPRLPSSSALGNELRRLTRPWRDGVGDELRRRLGRTEAELLLARVVDRFPASYRDQTDARTAADDVVEVATASHDLDVRVVRGRDGTGRVRVLVRDAPLVLSAFLPLLESHGLEVLEELPHRLADRAGEPVLHLHDFGVRGLPAGFDVPDAQRLADSLRATWDGRTANDSLHRLVLSAGLTWREAALLRAYRRYRRQVGTRYTPDYANDALAANPEVVRAVLAHVHARFDPDRMADPDEVEAARATALQACDAVVRLDHDRILRDLVALVDATLRTNLFTAQDAVIVLKFDPARVPDAPAPLPHRELFVLGAQVEGIHLRGGPVARGGLRWSDRQDDVRTEVLGLMKAQMRKNAVIVPTGAKGGFVLKHPPDDRDALRAAVEQQYRVFVRSLLSVTDDLDGDTVVPPERVRRWDGDDPYLVVAADKGTATFSDVANELAEDVGFWLGDAFASGGSQGYDHKALGITARGTWVAVRRHLLELGVHPEREPVSVVGVGDMSGDVFGNGMLSSRTLRLLAAFDHRHVLLDPDPDPEASFVERQRLFDLPRSSWADYDTGLLSPGGMVVSRDEKRVELTDEVRALLGVDDEVLPPTAVLRAVLRAQVDLLWFGGIGTYIKERDETHADVGDRANDEVRVDADDVRARVIGEGANLAITQRARIRYARRGGRVDQDAIHNAGGVDCSDHEVNVKILLAGAIRDGVLGSQERNELLAEVTDDVVTDVLRDVDLQVWRLSRDLDEGARRSGDMVHLLGLLEADDGLDRDVEVLPSDDELRTRAEAGAGLTRPELATLLGFAKRRLTTQLLASAVPDAAALQQVLSTYMPSTLEERFPQQLREHRLRRELVATRVANEVVDRMGPTFPSRVAAEADVDEATVVAAWWAARDVTATDPVWRRIEASLDEVGPANQDAMAVELEVLLGSLTRRYLADPLVGDVDAVVARDRDTVAAYATVLGELGTDEQRLHRRRRSDHLRDDLVEDDLAEWLSCTRDLSTAPEVAAVLRELGWDTGHAALVGDVLLRLLDGLGLQRLSRVLDDVATTTVWRRRLRRSLAADLRGLAARATQLALAEHGDEAPSPGAGERVAAAFSERRADRLRRAQRTIASVESDERAGLDGVTVALRTLRSAVEET
jgi:glutamate dehydrogenase